MPILRHGITVKNGTVRNYTVGINLLASTRATVRNVTVSSCVVGIHVGDLSRVEDCDVRDSDEGIRGGHPDGETEGASGVRTSTAFVRASAMIAESLVGSG